MKKYSKVKILKKVKETWACDYYYDGDSERKMPKINPPHVDIKIHENNVSITLSQMYEPPGLHFSQLLELSEFFGTKNINDDARFSYSGCGTCDYGSSYGFTLTIRPDKER